MRKSRTRFWVSPIFCQGRGVSKNYAVKFFAPTAFDFFLIVGRSFFMQSGRIPAVFIRDLSGQLPHSHTSPFEFCDIWRFWTLLHFAWRILHHLQENRFWAASDSIFDHVLEFLPHRFCFLGSFFWKMLPECSRMHSAFHHAFSVQFLTQFHGFLFQMLCNPSDRNRAEFRRFCVSDGTIFMVENDGRNLTVKIAIFRVFRFRRRNYRSR